MVALGENPFTGTVDRQIEELGKKSSWSMILDTPSNIRGALEMTMTMIYFVWIFGNIP